MNAKVQKCTFKFECDQQWDVLKEIRDESAVRYCGECNRGVYLCITTEEFQHHAQLGHCVAFAEDEHGQMDDPLDTALKFRVGEPSAVYAKVETNPQLDLDTDPSGC